MLVHVKIPSHPCYLMKEDDTSIPMMLCVVYYTFPELILHRIVISNTASSKRHWCTQHVGWLWWVHLKNEMTRSLPPCFFLCVKIICHDIIVCQVACLTNLGMQVNAIHSTHWPTHGDRPPLQFGFIAEWWPFISEIEEKKKVTSFASD